MSTSRITHDGDGRTPERDTGAPTTTSTKDPDTSADGSPPEKKTALDRVLGGVEAVGNKLPEPFTLFLILFLFTAAVSTVLAYFGAEVEVPGEDEKVVIKGFFTGEGLAWFTTTMGENYLGFPPLATVLPIMLAVGVSERSGMLSALIRKLFGSANRSILPYAVGLIGVTGSIMADAAFVVIPPLAAMVFKAAGRHPVAGLLGGFAAVGAGYSTALVPTSLDALFAGITNAVMDTLDAEIVKDAARFFEEGEKMQLSYAVRNTQRTVGTRTSSLIVQRYGMRNKLQPDHLTIRLTGSAGQSLGAFAAPGLKIEVSGDANDYVGKGLSGGIIVVKPAMGSPLEAASNDSNGRLRSRHCTWPRNQAGMPCTACGARYGISSATATLGTSSMRSASGISSPVRLSAS